MGCGSSTAARAAVPMDKDPEDYHLETLSFKPMKVEKFDTFLQELCDPVNTLVGICNDINEGINDIKDAAAVVIGGYKVSVEVDSVKAIDTVLLTFTKADGTYAPEADIQKLVADSKTKKADEDLSTAKNALIGTLSATPVALKVANDVLSAEGGPGEVEAFNKALADFRAAVGTGFKVTLAVKSTGALGAQGVKVNYTKPQWDTPDSDNVKHVAVTLLDIAKTKEAKNIFAAEAAIAEALAAIPKACTDLGDSAQVTFSIKKKKIQVKIEGGDAEDSSLADKKAALRKAVSNSNTQIFKLFKACANANGSLNVGRALVCVVDSVKTKVMKVVSEPAKAMSVIKVNPKMSTNDEGELEFDMDVKINLPEFDGKGLLELLPGPAKLTYSTIMDVVTKLKETFPQFKELSTQVQELIEKAGETFENPTETIKEAMPDANAMEYVKLAGEATKSLMKVKDCAKIVQVFIATAKRLSGELTQAVDELKTQFGAVTA